jgi:hypothetical protein
MKIVVPFENNVGPPNSSEPEAKTKKQQRSFRVFVREMKQRRVCRAAITYVLIMWLNLQIADVLVPMIGLPAWTLQLIVTIGVMGIPVVLLITWIFQVTPRGIVVDNRQPPTDQPISGWLETTVSLFLLVISLILATLLTMNFVAERESPKTNENVLIIRDMNFYGVTDEMKMVAKGLEFEVRHRIVNLEGVDLQLTSGNSTLSRNPGLAIIASVSKKEGRAYVLVQLVETSTGRYISSVVIDREVPPLEAPQAFLADRVIDNIMSHVRT